LDSGGLPQSYTYVKQFAEFADQRKLAYRIVLLPSLRNLFSNLPAQLHRDDVSFINLLALRDEFSENQFQASKFDSHPSAAVHQRIGESLAAYILKNYWLTIQK
jgi:hypothetical protein